MRARGLIAGVLALVLALSACGGTPVATPTPTSTPTPTAAPTSTATPAPAPEAVVEDRYAMEGDLPDIIRADVTIPQVRADLPGAGEVNLQIVVDYAQQLSGTLEDYAALFGGFAYPFHHIWYESYRLGDLYEICILGEVYSLYGSGPDRWVNRYYYDAAGGRAATEAEFLAAAGYTEAEILAAFRAEMVMEDDLYDYTYEYVRYSYYIDADKGLHFWDSLYA